MKKFNLFKEIIIVKRTDMINAINSAKTFGINIYGEVVYEPYAPNEILIFSGKHTPKQLTGLTPPSAFKLEDILGKNYQVVEDDERVLIKAFSNWQELIGVNMSRSSYDDTTADGVSIFANKKLEEIGWYATEFNIEYRTLVELLEEKCSGYTLCIEQEEPNYIFSGLGFIDNDEEAYEVMFEYVKQQIEYLIENDEDFARDNLTDDEEEAAKYFGL